VSYWDWPAEYRPESRIHFENGDNILVREDIAELTNATSNDEQWITVTKVWKPEREAFQVQQYRKEPARIQVAKINYWSAP
jgi:hypothetical protein